MPKKWLRTFKSYLLVPISVKLEAVGALKSKEPFYSLEMRDAGNIK